jgi:uncharacterized protein (TIGR03437 family)
MKVWISRGVRLILLLCAGGLSLQAQRMAATFSGLQAFLDVCPQNDPYFETIRKDFLILRNGAVTGVPACTEPYSKTPTANVTEELSILQALRFAYYMDMGRSGYLPWTPLRLYDWFKSKIGGFNINTTLDPTFLAASCCEERGGRKFVTLVRLPDDINRNSRLIPDGMMGQVALFAHEVRHTDGFPHLACCPAGSCDQTYDETKLSPYGIQYYLYKRWLSGEINLGYSCDAKLTVSLPGSFLHTVNLYPPLFCNQPPPMVSLPSSPGGACIPACTIGLASPFATSASGSGGQFLLSIGASTPACGWTAASNDEWVQITSGPNFSGSSVLNFSVAPNETLEPRAGTLIAAGIKLPIIQGTSPCSLSCGSNVPASGPLSKPVQFSSSVVGTRCTNITLDWDFGDGSAHSAAPSPTHTYSNAGAYFWTLRAQADGGASCSQRGQVQIAPCSVTCSSNVPAAGLAGTPVAFGGSVVGPNCSSLAVDWDFGDGSPHSTALNPAHAYASPGAYSWSLRGQGDATATCSQRGQVQVASSVLVSSVQSGAPDQPAIAGRSWVTIRGANLAQTTRTWAAEDFSGNTLPTMLDGVKVSIGGRDAAVWYISPTQLNVQAPSGLPAGNTEVQVSNVRGSASGTVLLRMYAPGFFLFDEKHVIGVHPDGAYVAAAGAFAQEVPHRPARSGDTILLFATGLGPTTPQFPAGQLVTGAAPLADLSLLKVTIGGVDAEVAFAGMVGVGLYQLNLVIPALPNDDHEVVATMNGIRSPSGKLLTVDNR